MPRDLTLQKEISGEGAGKFNRKERGSRQNGKPGYTAGGCTASVLLIEATEQSNRRLSILSTLLTDITIYLSRRLAILSTLSVSLACLY
jgi:hypothetical protein